MNTAHLFPGRLEGRTVLIVGGTCGIGLSAAIQAKAGGAEGNGIKPRGPTANAALSIAERVIKEIK